jgi:hypothetical protein
VYFVLPARRNSQVKKKLTGKTQKVKIQAIFWLKTA